MKFEMRGSISGFRNHVGVEIENREKWGHYPTIMGTAHHEAVEVNCREAGRKDRLGRVVYITPKGVEFAIELYGGNAENFASGEICFPDMDGRQSKEKAIESRRAQWRVDYAEECAKRDAEYLDRIRAEGRHPDQIRAKMGTA